MVVILSPGIPRGPSSEAQVSRGLKPPSTIAASQATPGALLSRCAIWLAWNATSRDRRRALVLSTIRLYDLASTSDHRGDRRQEATGSNTRCREATSDQEKA